MQATIASNSELEEVVSWVDTPDKCRYWGGPNISFPVDLPVLIDEIGFRENSSYTFRSDNCIAGFGQLVSKPGGVTHLARIICNPLLRGKGYGRRVCLSLLEIADDRGNTTTLNVYRANLPALNLYTSLGFVKVRDQSTKESVFMRRST